MIVTTRSRSNWIDSRIFKKFKALIMKKTKDKKGKQQKKAKPYETPSTRPSTTGPDPLLYNDKIIETHVTVIE